MADFLASENPTIDGYENMQKQTYRNRCYILGPNGKQLLVVPTAKNNNSRSMKDIRISYAENWRKEHFKSLEAAYRRSPYFEYYEYVFEAIFAEEHTFLFDLNKAILERILTILQSDAQITYTEAYHAQAENDFREKYQAKEKPVEITKYTQVFDEKLDFVTDLSIIDLICNQGPQSTIYLNNII